MSDIHELIDRILYEDDIIGAYCERSKKRYSPLNVNHLDFIGRKIINLLKKHGIMTDSNIIAHFEERYRPELIGAALFRLVSLNKIYFDKIKKFYI